VEAAASRPKPHLEADILRHEVASHSPYRRSSYVVEELKIVERVRKVKPDSVGGEVLMPRLFKKVRVRLKIF